MERNRIPLVVTSQFIRSARDSGYRSVGHALAELVDNAFEADANSIHIDVSASEQCGPKISITDDGRGMKPSVLKVALQFGGSSRFNSRRGSGRYGVGLPNASLAMSRKVEVVSWTCPRSVWRSSLNVGELVKFPESGLEPPQRTRLAVNSHSGTKVIWHDCDNAELNGTGWLERLTSLLGQIFRKWLWAGKVIYVNESPVKPIDPLMLQVPERLKASLVGPPLKYFLSCGEGRVSEVTVIFTKLPFGQSDELSSKDKLRTGITRRAGVSVIRGQREIDYGWFFLGTKRRENYDDWWRCEITFEPDLDEVFGVTNTKQGIRPSALLQQVLQPDIESIARKLNAEVRIGLGRQRKERAVRLADTREVQLEPLPAQITEKGGKRIKHNKLRYSIHPELTRDACDDSFFEPEFKDDHLSLRIRMDHPFVATTLKNVGVGRESSQTAIHLLLLAASRAEEHLAQLGLDRELLRTYRVEWGRVLASFCE